MTGDAAGQAKPGSVQPEKLTRIYKNRQPALTGVGGFMSSLSVGMLRLLLSFPRQ